jgi:ribose/xylose/arabinose/galactoside ABC-type transport system permease subunit
MSKNKQAFWLTFLLACYLTAPSHSTFAQVDSTLTESNLVDSISDNFLKFIVSIGLTTAIFNALINLFVDWIKQNKSVIIEAKKMKRLKK